MPWSSQGCSSETDVGGGGGEGKPPCAGDRGQSSKGYRIRGDLKYPPPGFPPSLKSTPKTTSASKTQNDWHPPGIGDLQSAVLV